VANEKEEAVPAVHLGQEDGASQSASVLIALQYVAGKPIGIIEERRGVEPIVAKKLKATPMPLVGSGLGDDADHTAAISPVFRRIVAFENAKFRDRVRIGVKNDTVVEQVVVQSAIQQEGNRVAAPAWDAVLARRRCVAIGLGNARL